MVLGANGMTMGRAVTLVDKDLNQEIEAATIPVQKMEELTVQELLSK